MKRNWCFTAFTEPHVPVTHKHFRYAIFQKERCPETKREHYQGYIEFSQGIKLQPLKLAFEDDTVHFEGRRGTREQARAYCMKADTQLEAPKEFGEWTQNRGARVDLQEARTIIMIKRKREELYQDPELDQIMTKFPKWAENVLQTKKDDIQVDIELYEWQKNVLVLLDAEPVRRRIIWIWSVSPKTGKSTFYDYVSSTRDVLPGCNNWADLIYAYDKNSIVWFDFTRQQYPCYDILEKISNHSYHLSTKFNSHRKYVKTHVVVTANIPPNENVLQERCVIFDVEPGLIQ